MIPFCILVIEDDDDREFMAALFIQYQRLLYKEIHDILKNPWNTEDVLQATLVKLIDKLPELRNKEQPQLIGYIDEGEQKRLIYGETDSNPMQLFFTAFLSEQEAAEEHANAKDKEAEYTKARTAADYFHVIDDSFNP